MRGITFAFFIILVLVYIVLAQEDGGKASICPENLDLKSDNPVGIFKKKLLIEQIDADGCSKQINLNYIKADRKFRLTNHPSGQSETWLTSDMVSNNNRFKTSDLWVVNLAMARPDLKIIDYNKKNKWIFFGGQFKDSYSLWMWVLSNASDSKDSIKQWKLIDLADKNFTAEFGKKLEDPATLEKSHLSDLVSWGVEQGFSNLTVRAILPGKANVLNNEKIALNKLAVGKLSDAFNSLDAQHRPSALSTINSSNIEFLSYLVETEKDGNTSWYSWQGGVAHEINTYKETARLEKDRYFAWYRLINDKAITVACAGEETGDAAYTYVNYDDYEHKKPDDIYCIKATNDETDNLYRPTSFVAKATSRSLLDSITSRESYEKDDLIRYVAERWIQYDSAFFVVTTADAKKAGLNPKGTWGLLSIYLPKDIGGNICLHGFNKGIASSTRISCSICDFILYSEPILTGLSRNELRIISVQKKTNDSLWYVGIISKVRERYDFKILSIYMPSHKTDTIACPLDSLFGTAENIQAAKNAYVRRIWNKHSDSLSLEKDLKFRFGSPPKSEYKCDEWTSEDPVIDAFLRNNFLGKKMESPSNPKIVIKQLFPGTGAGGTDPRLYLTGGRAIVHPVQFQTDMSWRYLVKEGDRYKKIGSDSRERNNEWFGDIPFEEFQSAWLAWLALCYEELKIISTAKDCDSAGEHRIMVSFMLQSSSSLFSWIGRSDSAIIPTQKEMISSGDHFFLKNAPVNQYLYVLYTTRALKSETKFYCQKSELPDFQIADFFPETGKDRTVLYHLSGTSINDTLICLSDKSNNDRRISFDYVLGKGPVNNWDAVKKIYNNSGTNFRETFGKVAVLYPEPDACIRSFWGSPEKFGILRGNQSWACVFPKNSTRFKFTSLKAILDSSSREKNYVTRSDVSPKVEDLFWSWVNIDYRVGHYIAYYWRANPLGYFDRIK